MKIPLYLVLVNLIKMSEVAVSKINTISMIVI